MIAFEIRLRLALLLAVSVPVMSTLRADDGCVAPSPTDARVKVYCTGDVVDGVYLLQTAYAIPGCGTNTINFAVTMVSGAGNVSYAIGSECFVPGNHIGAIGVRPGVTGYTMSTANYEYNWASGCSGVLHIDRNITIYGPSCTWSIAGELERVCPDDGVAHEVTVEVAGVEVASNSWPIEAPSITYSFDGTAHDGESVIVKVDGVTIDTREMGCTGDPPPSNDWITGLTTIGSACTEPTPTPTPTPGPSSTPGPSISPPPAPTIPPAPTPPPPSTPYPSPASNSNVHITNPQDIYGPIVGDGNVPSVGLPELENWDLGEATDYGGADGELNSDKAKEIVDEVGDMTDGFKDNLSLDKALSLPSVGSATLTWEFDIGGTGRSASLASATLPPLHFTFNLEPYATPIVWLRNLMLVALYLQFWFWTCQVIRQAIA